MSTLERVKKNLFFDCYQRDNDAVCMVRITDLEKLLAVVEAAENFVDDPTDDRRLLKLVGQLAWLRGTAEEGE